MTLKEQQKQIDQMQRRIAELVDELRTTQADVRQFKSALLRGLRLVPLQKEKGSTMVLCGTHNVSNHLRQMKKLYKS